MKISKTGKSITLDVSVWRQPDGQIRVTGKNGRSEVFMTTVTDKIASKRRHMHLFDQLNEILKKAEAGGAGT